MTRSQAEKKGWTIGRVMSGGWYARKGRSLEIANTLTALLKKLW